MAYLWHRYPLPLLPFSNRSLADQPAASAGDAGTGARARKAAIASPGRRLTDRRSSPTGEPVPPSSTPPGDDRDPKKRIVRLDDRMDIDSPRSTPPRTGSPPLERNRRDRQDGNAGATTHSQQPPQQQNRRQPLPGPRNDAPPPSSQRAQPNPPTQAFRSQAPAGGVPRAFTSNAPAASTGEARTRQRPTSSVPVPNRREIAGGATGAGGGDAGPGGASASRSRSTTGSASSTASSSSSAAHAAAANVSQWAAPPPVDPTLAIHNAAAVLAARRESVGAVAHGAQYIPGGRSRHEAPQRNRAGQVPRYIPGRGNPSAERGGSSPRSPPSTASTAAFRSRAHYDSPASRQQQAQDDQWWARANRSPNNPSGGEERDGGGRRRRGPDYR